jgi:site-specific recombinase XerC
MPTAIDRQISSFGRWLRFENKSDNTITIYVGAATKMSRWLVERDVTDWAAAEPEHVRDFIISILESRSAGYANNLFRSLQQFAKWYAAEHDEPNVMIGMRPPLLPELETPVLRDDQLKALLKGCEGKEFVQRRDAAILYLFLDSGIRRAELTALEVPDLDLDYREVTVLGKGRRTRTVGFGRKAAWSLDRYVTVRADHKLAELPQLWLGEKGRGPMTGSGIFQMIQRRGEAIGVAGLHPHTMRHTWAHLMKQSSMGDDEIMKNAGWRSPQMLARYAASTAAERARESAKRLAPGDRL